MNGAGFEKFLRPAAHANTLASEEVGNLNERNCHAKSRALQKFVFNWTSVIKSNAFIDFALTNLSLQAIL
jgi:hypothetical protein